MSEVRTGRYIRGVVVDGAVGVLSTEGRGGGRGLSGYRTWQRRASLMTRRLRGVEGRIDRR